MNEDEKMLLQKMIRTNNTEDNTNKIQEAKHSMKIRRDVSIIQNIKRRTREKDFRKLDNDCRGKCNFLYVNYPNIYNKMLRGEVDIQILYKFLDKLNDIEEGRLSQHEASYEIGMYLRSLYVDKRLNKSSRDKTRQDKPINNNKQKNMKLKSHGKMSYDDFKKTQNIEGENKQQDIA